MERRTGTSATRAKNKYYKNNYDPLRISAMRGRKAFYEKMARAMGADALNKFFIEAAEEKMKRGSPEVFAEMEAAEAARKAAETAIADSTAFSNVQEAIDKGAACEEWDAIYSAVAAAASAGVKFADISTLEEVRDRSKADSTK